MVSYFQGKLFEKDAEIAQLFLVYGFILKK